MASRDKNPIDMLMHWARLKAEEPWLFQPRKGQWHTINWSAAEAQVRSMATALRSLGLEAGARVAISGINTAHWFLADLAINMAGYVSVGLYPKQAPETVRYILEHSETQVLFLGPMPDAEAFMGGVPAHIRTIGFPYPGTPVGEFDWDTLVAQHEPFSAYQPPAPTALMTLVYTSGTTGQPKGVMVTQDNAQFVVEGCLKAMPPQGNEKLFCYLPLAHMFERGAVELTSLYLGAEVYFLEGLDKLAEQLPQAAPTRFFAVPLVYSRMQAGILKKMPQEKLDRLLRIPLLSSYIKYKIKKGIGLHRARYIVAGAAPMPVSVMQWFETVGITILQGYGMTENSIYATVNLPGANRIGSVGRPLPDAGLSIADDGEILFRSRAVMAGYYKDPARTAAAFTADGALRTGDQGRIEDGYLFITGRVKDIFKTLKGKYVAPAPIEAAMARSGNLDQLTLIGSGLNQPVLLANLSEAGKSKPRDTVESELKAALKTVNADLEPHEAVAKIVIVKDAWNVDNDMATPTMKIKRAAVEKHYQALVEREAAHRGEAVAWEA